MSADDDTELRDLVIDSLEKKGVLGKIKAELRATVFLALEENEKDQGDGNGLRTGRSQQELYRFLSTENGILTFSLVMDFLQQFDLDFSLAVLDPEASSPRKCIPRNELGSLLKLCPESDMHCPLLELLLTKKKASEGNRGQDQNGNNPQVTKNPIPENGIDTRSSVNDVDVANKGSSLNKQQQSQLQSESKDILSRLPGQDSFFDDPLPSARNNSLFFNFSGKPSPPKSVPGSNESQTFILSSLEGEEQKERSNGNLGAVDLSDGELKKQSFGLSSLQDLPSLVNEPLKPKEGRRQWKDTDPEQRERFMNMTFGSKLGLTDTFSSSLIDGGGDAKECPELDPSDPLDQEPSIEENIEEDLSGLGDDLLNSNISSSKEDNQTLDRSVSDFSKAGGYDYMENVT